MIRYWRILAPLLWLLSLAGTATELSGRVVSIVDGDTFTHLTSDKQQIKIRLAEIDAPESAQPYGNRSKQALSGLIFGKDVRVAVRTIDRYGRTVGRPYVSDLDVCAEMVRTGTAWVYRQYVGDKGLFKIESEAKAALRGLWALPEAEQVAPWDWRRSGSYRLITVEDANRRISAESGHSLIVKFSWCFQACTSVPSRDFPGRSTIPSRCGFHHRSAIT